MDGQEYDADAVIFATGFDLEVRLMMILGIFIKYRIAKIVKNTTLWTMVWYWCAATAKPFPQEGEDDDYHYYYYQNPFDYLDYHQASAKPYPQEGLEGELASNYGDAPSAYLGSWVFNRIWQTILSLSALVNIPNESNSPLLIAGITHPSHPNFFILHGPGTGLGHNSVIFMIECQVLQSPGLS